jgi:hypothetical protein
MLLYCLASSFMRSPGGSIDQDTSRLICVLVLVPAIFCFDHIPICPSPIALHLGALLPSCPSYPSQPLVLCCAWGDAFGQGVHRGTDRPFAVFCHHGTISITCLSSLVTHPRDHGVSIRGLVRVIIRIRMACFRQVCTLYTADLLYPG